MNLRFAVAAARARSALPFATAALLLAAAIDWSGVGFSGKPHRLVLVDVSPSVGRDAGSILASLETSLRAAAAPGARLSVIVFDAVANPVAFAEDGDLGPLDSIASGLSREPRAAATDVGAAIDAALARLAGDPGDIVVLSDFAETRGDAVAAAARAAASGVPVYAVVILAPPRPDAGVEAIDAPAAAPAGSRIAIRVTVASRMRGERSALVSLSRDGVELGSKPIRLRDRDSAQVEFEDALAVAPGAAAAYRANVSLDEGATADAIPENDALVAIVRATGPPRVVAARADGALASALAAAGFSVVVADPIDRVSLAGADAVAIDDVPFGGGEDGAPARALSRSEAEAIRDFVVAGGALVASGAERAFGPGLWRGTPLEAALPVECAPRDRPPLAILLVLDASGSMAAQGKFDRAREAAEAVAAALRDGDRAGLIAFRDGIAAETPFAARSEAKRALASAMRSLEPRGGTRLETAFAAAVERLSAEPGERHAIVLSDGLSDGRGGAASTPLADSARIAREKGITVTVIATGTEIDAERLRGLGRVVVARDPSTLTRRFLEDVARRDLASGEQTTVTVTAGPDFDGRDGDALPFGVEWLARTTAKPGAKVRLVTPAGDPVLVDGRVGAGFAVAIPVGLDGIGGERALRVASPLLSERLRAAASLRGDGIAAAVELETRGCRVVVRGWPAGTPLPVAARLEPGGGTSFVEPLAETRFEVVFPHAAEASGPMDAVFLSGSRGDAGEAVMRFPIPARPAREFTYRPDPFARSEAVARSGGGRVVDVGALATLPPPIMPIANGPGARRSDFPAIGALCLVAAIALLLFEAALRAFRRGGAGAPPLTSAGPNRR